MIIKPTTPKIYTPHDPSCVLNLSGHDIAAAKIYDRSGKGNHGTISGALRKPSNYGLPVLSFDGTDDRVAASDVGETINGAMLAWINMKSFTASNYNQIISQDDNFQLTLFDGYVVCRVRDNVGWKDVSSINRINANCWILVANSWDGLKNKVYLNGILNNEISAGNCISPTGILTVGCHVSYSLFFHGNIDGVMIYNRVLSAQEIIAYFNQTKHLFGQ
ncbi:LamG domain-containing protein [Patescibacteria group bacterium]|nr:LamG domain-containing protein [Patescibacteria group bacterium]MBU4353379.1 LamG domain-containing protein [Patescibacteria group bacterium]MBU4477465.1 LamG domain-containing protein [Patescibacteria group bacterium]MCG2699125.1 LamG domain-containing protein [Candidatus Parcubacteria bacterium]